MRKWFTLIELIIVTTIISILILSISFLKQKSEDKKIKFGKECSIYILKEITNKKNQIDKNKVINLNSDILSHISSKVVQEKQWLLIYSSYENNNSLLKPLTNDKWFCLAEHISNRNNYTIKAKEDFWINIEKNLVHINNNEILSVCDADLKECIEISEIIYNKAKNKFEYKFCSSFNSEICNKWIP